MSVERISLANYDVLDNKPILNQDLTASGFNPTAGEYYKNTGTDGIYVQGLIYFYNGSEYLPVVNGGGESGKVSHALTIGGGGHSISFDGSEYKVVSLNDDNFESQVGSAGGIGTIVFNLSDTDVTEGAYNNVTVDAKGRVTAGENKDYALKSDIPAGITSIDGLEGGSIKGDISSTGNVTIGGNLTVNGTTTSIDSTTLRVTDKLIEVAKDNTEKLTTPAGLVAPKYDGTNSGALVFDGDGTAYVGNVTLDSTGNIDVSKSELQPLATRTGLVGGNLVQYDSTEQTLKDSGKKIGDLATTSAVNAKYTKPSVGIPKTDLASDVQTSLGKADTAMQTHQDISGKANLAGGNTFTGNQQFNQGGYWFATATNHPFVVELENGDALITVNPNGVSFDSDGLGTMPFLLNGNAGTSGQVLTSQGSGKTPKWTDLKFTQYFESNPSIALIREILKSAKGNITGTFGIVVGADNLLLPIGALSIDTSGTIVINGAAATELLAGASSFDIVHAVIMSTATNITSSNVLHIASAATGSITPTFTTITDAAYSAANSVIIYWNDSKITV